MTYDTPSHGISSSFSSNHTLQVLNPNNSNHCIPNTKSGPMSGKEYKVVENLNPWIVMETCSYLSLQTRLSPFATFTLNSVMGVTANPSEWVSF